MTIEDFDGISPVISSSAWIHKSAAVIGQVEIGEQCSIWPNANLRADEGSIHIGDYSNIQDGSTVHMTGGLSVTKVGARVTVGHNCILHGCIIEDDVLIGMGSIVMDNAVVGAGSYIGAGTLITAGKVIPPKSLVFGNPMQIKRATNEKEAMWIQYAWKHYVENSRKYLAGET